MSAEITRTKHVVLIGLDGLRADSLLTAQTPIFDTLISNGAYTLEAISSLGQPTASGPSWSSILTGVWADKHGVQDNTFDESRYDDFPCFPVRLSQTRPGSRTASFVNWAPINDCVPLNAEFERRMIPDATVVSEAIRVITDEGPDATFLQLDEIDGAGHDGGYVGNPKYMDAVSRADTLVGDVIEAVSVRQEGRGQEDWLVIIVSDHGGTNGGTHGGLSREEIVVPFLMVGDRVKPGEMAAPVYTVDAPVTALDFLGLTIDPVWGLDGTPRGLYPKANYRLSP
jgi:predicted AlkP superfamily pyrophosphatase or phosphodiesterase